ncbi:MAG TPA: sulfotransferase [Rhizomicrobium sp.]|jgi:Tfp pilus assembly protein PilF
MAEIEADDDRVNLVAEQVIAAARTGDDALAIELADRALGDGMRHPALYNVRASGYWRDALYRAALDDLRSAVAMMPRNPMLWDKIGFCQLKLNEWKVARLSFETAIANAPALATAHYGRGLALQVLGDRVAAKAAHGRAVELKPDFAEALGSLALMSMGESNIPVARRFAERAFAVDRTQPTARIAMAMSGLQSGAIKAAAQGVSEVLQEGKFGDDPQANTVLGLIADAFDQRGDCAQAFAISSGLNRKRREIQEPRFKSSRASEVVHRLRRHFEREQAWPAPDNVQDASGPAAGHVFLLGFARSGTTLLETILASNAAVAALDERDCFSDAAKETLADETGIARLAALDGPELEEWRRDYWKSVQNAGANVAGRVFVDKWPFNSYRLPLIAKMFPHARVLLALRDPRDVVLSCFRRRFVQNADTFEFLVLEDCARFYAEIMDLVATMRPKLPLAIHQHRYEDMITNFDDSVRSVCEFIGIPWNENMREFQRAADGVLHPNAQSGQQVRRGLYKGAIGQWHRYARELAPVLPILEPWVERYGYSQVS